MKNLKTTLFTALLFCSPFCLSQDLANVQISTQKINDKIYMLQGSGGNIGVLVGNDGTLIIDDQFAPLTEKIKAAIGKISDHPTQFVLNTHWHYDHTDGNENFGGAGAVIVSHENSRSRMAADQVLGMSGRKQEAYSAEGLPKITFAETMTFHYNGETVNVFHVGPAHTDGDAIIHFVESNVFHTGDVFVRYGLPFIDQPNGGNVEGMIAFVDAVASIADDNSKIIPGHGQVSTKKDLIAYSDMLKSITATIKQSMDKGLSLQQITDSKPLQQYPDGFVTQDAFVKIVYDSILANR
jgi:glyoxylase-like metal-dependent hydrolase (beta-lactamase superfamily II)